MAYTLGNAKDKVTYYVDDLNKGYFTDVQLNRFINDAQFEVQKLLLQSGNNWYLTVSTTPIVASQAEYVLPSDFLHLHRLVVVTQNLNLSTEVNNLVFPITTNQQDIYPFSPGSVQAYYLKKSRLVLVPFPDSSQASYYLKLFYSYRVATLVLDADNVDVPDEYCELVPIMAAIDCYIKDGRDASLLMAKKLYYEDMMKKEAEQRRQDMSRQVIVTSDGGFGALFSILILMTSTIGSVIGII